MNFYDLDKKMRVYETAHDLCVMPGMFIVARLDGRGFTRLTKETFQFQAPFDEKFRDMMLETTQGLMSCGFKIVFGYTQSDEISLLFHSQEESFLRKTRKLNSVLAGEGSARLSLLLGEVAVFDCRISELPNLELVVDYFRWRQEDAHRNALNSHCYWALRHNGLSAAKATSRLEFMTVPQKHELLFAEFNTNFNDLPLWQKRGSGLYWKDVERIGVNPMTGEEVTVSRKKITQILDLPIGDSYGDLIRSLGNEGLG